MCPCCSSPPSPSSQVSTAQPRAVLLDLPPRLTQCHNRLFRPTGTLRLLLSGHHRACQSAVHLLSAAAIYSPNASVASRRSAVIDTHYLTNRRNFWARNSEHLQNSLLTNSDRRESRLRWTRRDAWVYRLVETCEYIIACRSASFAVSCFWTRPPIQIKCVR